MKIEEAIDRAVFVNRIIVDTCHNDPRDGDALDVLIAHAESTRWRKLSEEQPTEQDLNNSANKTLQVWRYEMRGYSFIVNGLPEDQFNVWTRVTHWRPIVGPEEES